MSIAGAKSSGTAVTQVDVFTDKPYTGNPAGVCVLVKEQQSSTSGAFSVNYNSRRLTIER